MLGDLRDPRHGRGAAARHRALRAAGDLQRAAPRARRLRRRAAQAHAPARAAVARRPRRAPRRGAGRAGAAGRGARATRRREIDGIAARAVVTDVGVDLICDAEQTAALDRRADRRAAPGRSREAAAEVLRVERGRPRYGVDLDDTTIPQEAGLNERAVSFTKGCYVGQETVARLFYKGKPNRHLRGLRLSAPVAPGTELTARRQARRPPRQRRRLARARPDRARARAPRGGARRRARRRSGDRDGRRAAVLTVTSREAPMRTLPRSCGDRAPG